MKQVFLTLTAWAAISALNTALEGKSVDASASNTIEAYARVKYDGEHSYDSDPSEEVQAIMDTINDDHDGLLLSSDGDGNITATIGNSNELPDGVEATEDLHNLMASLTPAPGGEPEAPAAEQTEEPVAAGEVASVVATTDENENADDRA